MGMPIQTFLARSEATAEFRDAIDAFLRTGEAGTRLAFDRRCPPVKVERTLTKILQEYATLPIDTVHLNAVSGCDSFRGYALIGAGVRTVRVRFEWNCRWKAEQMGWTDWFDLPDQARAAREFGYDCFREWTEEQALEHSGV